MQTQQLLSPSYNLRRVTTVPDLSYANVFVLKLYPDFHDNEISCLF